MNASCGSDEGQGGGPRGSQLLAEKGMHEAAESGNQSLGPTAAPRVPSFLPCRIHASRRRVGDADVRHAGLSHATSGHQPSRRPSLLVWVIRNFTFSNAAPSQIVGKRRDARFEVRVEAASRLPCRRFLGRASTLSCTPSRGFIRNARQFIRSSITQSIITSSHRHIVTSVRLVRGRPNSAIKRLAMAACTRLFSS